MVQNIVTLGGINAIATMISMHVAPTNLYINKISLGGQYGDVNENATSLGSENTISGASRKTATASLESGHIGKLTASFTPIDDILVGEAGAFTVSGVLAARVTNSRQYIVQATRTMNVSMQFHYSR